MQIHPEWLIKDWIDGCRVADEYDVHHKTVKRLEIIRKLKPQESEDNFRKYLKALEDAYKNNPETADINLSDPHVKEDFLEYLDLNTLDIDLPNKQILFEQMYNSMR